MVYHMQSQQVDTRFPRLVLEKNDNEIIIGIAISQL